MAKKDPTDPRSHDITVYLMKPHIQDFQEVLVKLPKSSGRKLPKSIELTGLPAGVTGRLYPTAKSSGKPRWMSMLEEGIPPTVARHPFKTFAATTASALLLLKRGVGDPPQTRFFALTFGSGARFLLEPGIWESRFGLRVAMNVADPTKFRQVLSETHEGQVLLHETSASKLSPLNVFGFDSEQDLLRKLTAKLEGNTLGVRITGKDSVGLTCQLKYETLSNKCGELFDEYVKEDYKTKFPELEAIVPVDDPFKEQELNKKLVEELRQTDWNTVSLWPPDPVTFDENYGGLRIAGDIGPGREALVLGDTLPAKDPAKPIEIKDLRSVQIETVTQDDQSRGGPWRVWDAIYHELPDGDSTYVFVRGEWFEYANSFVEKLNTYIDKEVDQSKDLECEKFVVDDSEDDFIARVVASGGYTQCHRKMVYHGGGRSQIEFCDLFRKNGNLYTLVHLKKGASGEDTGHLMNQGLASLELTLSDPEFRQKAIEKLDAVVHECLDGTRSASEFHVLLCVMQDQESKLVDALSLFGKVTLRRAHRALKRMGAKVSAEVLYVNAQS